ncbi:MAG TPA: ArsR family transcriptional regulator [Planctomycetota bacterium]|jgi:hypothetical protein|nr:ArsR family transcriptional regulator [Planctomycetota bacterium]
MNVPRISARALHRRLAKADGTLLVCAYESDDRFREMEIEGAIPWSAFQSRLPSLPLDQEIVFYCA